MMDRLAEMEEKYECIGNVRGIGLMIGIEIVKSKRTREPDEKTRSAIVDDAFGKGLLLLPAGESSIRICPPLIINKEQAEKGLDILEDAIKEISTG
jgi:4-aminobutyrate aminotransferase